MASDSDSISSCKQQPSCTNSATVRRAYEVIINVPDVQARTGPSRAAIYCKKCRTLSILASVSWASEQSDGSRQTSTPGLPTALQEAEMTSNFGGIAGGTGSPLSIHYKSFSDGCTTNFESLPLRQLS